AQTPAAARAAGHLDDGSPARADWPGCLDRRRLESGGLPVVAPPDGGLATRRIFLTAIRAAPVPRAHGRPAATARDMERRRIGGRRSCARLPRATRARQAGSQGARMGTHRHRDAPGGRAPRPRGAVGGSGRHGARCPRGPDPREAPLAPGAEKRVRVPAAAWWFVAPALLVIGVFFFVPVLAALALSLTDFDLYALADLRNVRWVGLQNYVRLLANPLFWHALGNTVYFVVVGVPLSIGLSLGAALLLHSRVVRWRAFFRTALFAPVVTTLVAVAVIWRYLLDTRYGWLNYALGSIGVSPIDWLGDPRWAMPAIILFAVWKSFG